ncbi:MAG: hypothetical protein LQ350_001111 [Teloschistes chrysophthalmus]|nr:MAG: hypothetical protein LQ350_001111 [Niorma chrysophthalma]
MPRPRPRRASSAVGDVLRGDTSVSALSTVEPAPTFESPPLTPNGQPHQPRELQERPEVREAREQRERARRRRRQPQAWPWNYYEQWKAFSFRHTWANPLITILIVLTLYGIYPYSTNPLSSAIFLSYPLDPSDPLIPAAVRADPKAPLHYGKGPKDIAFVAFYIVVLSFTREFIMQRVLRPIARWCKMNTRSKQNRFLEQTYTGIYFGIFSPYGLYVMYHSPVWYFNTAGMYETFPNRTHDALFKAYYLLQASYWAQQALVLVMLLEKPRKDFKELVGHHVVTLSLIGLSYRFHFTYMGLAVYITHDISDFFLATSKTLSYLDARIVTPYFSFFIAVWVYLRHYTNLRILRSIGLPFPLPLINPLNPLNPTTYTTTNPTLSEFATLGPFELNWETQQYKCWIAQYISFALLACLQAINVFWLWYIAKVAVKVWRGGVKKDERSDDEEEDDEGEEEERREEERQQLLVDQQLRRELSGAVANGTVTNRAVPNGVMPNGRLGKENQAPPTTTPVVAVDPVVKVETKKEK